MDNMILDSYEQLSEVRTKHTNKKIVFCSGAFDLVHVGHVLFFEDCRRYGDILVVGVAEDAIIKKNKENLRPILNEHIRLRMIDSLKPVDYCYLDRMGVEHKENTLSLLGIIFENLRPNVYVINSDAFNIPYRQELIGRYHTELKILPRYCPPEFEDISTTKIIEKIKGLS